MSPPMPRSLRFLFVSTATGLIVLGAIAVAGQGHAGATALVLATVALGVIALGLAWRRVARIAAGEGRHQSALLRGAQETLALLRMTETLQRCRDVADVERAVADVAQRVLPGASGTLHIMPRGFDGTARALSWGAAAPDCAAAPSARNCAAIRLGRMSVGGEAPACGGCALGSRAGAALCLPVMAESEVHGVLQLGGAVAPRAAQAQRMALAIAESAGFALGNLAIREGLRGQALRDPLTGLHNRRFLAEVVDGLVHQAARRGSALAVAMLDLDHFKRLNDEHGHAVGDAVLRDIGALLATRLRRSDIACRYGGEEFLIVLPDCDAVQAWARMDELRRLVVARRLGGITGHRVTCCIGIAALAGDTDIATAIAEADGALYVAKRAGRNRVVVAARDAPGSPVALEIVGAAA